MYWRGAFPGLAFETHPALGGDVTIDEEKLRSAVERYTNTLQRFIAAEGMSVKSLAPQVVDPTPQIEAYIVAICVKLGIPKRIFMGSERGELASGQDDSTWNGRLKDRQTNYITPRIISPFIDRLIQVGVLPTPQGFSVKWPDLDALQPNELAMLANRNTEAMAKYIQGEVDLLIAPIDFLTKYMRISDREAEAIIAKTEEHIKKANPDSEEEVVPGRNPAPKIEEVQEPIVEGVNGAAGGSNGKSGRTKGSTSVKSKTASSTAART